MFFVVASVGELFLPGEAQNCGGQIRLLHCSAGQMPLGHAPEQATGPYQKSSSQPFSRIKR